MALAVLSDDQESMRPLKCKADKIFIKNKHLCFLCAESIAYIPIFG